MHRPTVISVALGVLLALTAPGCGSGPAATTDAATGTDAGVDAASPPDAAVPEDTGIDAPSAPDASLVDAGPRSCGGRTGGTCLTNEFCHYTPADFCGRADATGICSPIPDACATGTTEVCGCDGATYATECFANAAGTSVDHPGPCL